MQQMNQVMCSTIDDFDNEIQKWQQVLDSAQGCPSVEIEAHAQMGALDTWRRALEQSLSSLQSAGPDMQQRGMRDVMDTCTKAHTVIMVSKQKLEQEYGMGDQPLSEIGMENVFPSGMSQTYGMGRMAQTYGMGRMSQQYGPSRTTQQYGMGRTTQLYGTMGMGRVSQQYETPEQYGTSWTGASRQTSQYGTPQSSSGSWSQQQGMSQFGVGRETAQYGSAYGTSGHSSMQSQRYGQEARDPFSREFGREPLRVQELRKRYGNALYPAATQSHTQQQRGQSSRAVQRNW